MFLKKTNCVEIPRSFIETLIINHIKTYDKTVNDANATFDWDRFGANGVDISWVEEIGNEKEPVDPAIDMLMEEIKQRNEGTEQFWPGGEREGVRSQG
jgi:hypothetical protein